jgi:hypothetical protein
MAAVHACINSAICHLVCDGPLPPLLQAQLCCNLDRALTGLCNLLLFHGCSCWAPCNKDLTPLLKVRIPPLVGRPSGTSLDP